MSTAETATRYYAIKVKRKDARQWQFLTPQGRFCQLLLGYGEETSLGLEEEEEAEA